MTHHDQYIEIDIGEERYALKINDIHEIIKMQAITQIPATLPYVKGIISLRGRIVTVISLRSKFGFEEVSATKATRIVVVNHNNDKVGVIVDKVNQVTSFTAIQPPPANMGLVQSSYLSGIGHTETGVVCVLKLQQILQE